MVGYDGSAAVNTKERAEEMEAQKRALRREFEAILCDEDEPDMKERTGHPDVQAELSGAQAGQPNVQAGHPNMQAGHVGADIQGHQQSFSMSLMGGGREGDPQCIYCDPRFARCPRARYGCNLPDYGRMCHICSPQISEEIIFRRRPLGILAAPECFCFVCHQEMWYDFRADRIFCGFCQEKMIGCSQKMGPNGPCLACTCWVFISHSEKYPLCYSCWYEHFCNRQKDANKRELGDLVLGDEDMPPTKKSAPLHCLYCESRIGVRETPENPDCSKCAAKYAAQREQDESGSILRVGVYSQVDVWGDLGQIFPTPYPAQAQATSSAPKEGWGEHWYPPEPLAPENPSGWGEWEDPCDPWVTDEETPMETYDPWWEGGFYGGNSRKHLRDYIGPRYVQSVNIRGYVTDTRTNKRQRGNSGKGFEPLPGDKTSWGEGLDREERLSW